MISISLCMIVKNEEEVLERCLSSVYDLVDEIVIVDTGSTDNTKQIAKKFTNLIYDFEWIDDFSAARNFSFSKATKDYQMWLDADDVFEKEDREKFKKLKSEITNDIDVILMSYNIRLDKNNLPDLTAVRVRIVRRERNYIWIEPVHECLEGNGKVFHATDIFVTHKKEQALMRRNITIYESQLKNGKKLSRRSIYHFAVELQNIKRYEEAIFYFNKFLSSQDSSWEILGGMACFYLGSCYNVLGKQEEAFEAFLRSFRYGTFRAEICCKIGYYFKDKKEYDISMSWFRTASKLEKGGILSGILNDYWEYTPNIELAIYYLAINNVEKAAYYHGLAKKYKPNSEDVLYIENYLNHIKN